MLRILYLEDNPEAIHHIERIAEVEGYELFTAETIEEGLRLLDLHRPNLLLVDMLLPDGDGTDFTRIARARGVTCPIIIITGYAISGEREACFAAGCTEFLTKPVEMSTFFELFKKYAEGGV